MKKRRILWQSSQAVHKFPDYRDAILRHGEKILGPDFQLVVRGVDKGTTDVQFLSYDFLNNIQVFHSVVRAEKEGLDAVAIGCFLDPILDELREIIEIPVLSLGEVGMLTACMLGKRFSVITYVPQLKNKRFAELIHKYGLTERSVKIMSFDLPFVQLDKGFKDPSTIIEKFTAASREAIAEGAEVLVPGCGCLNLILAENRVDRIDGAAIVDVTGALMKMTEMMIVLKEVSGTRVSRRGFNESPPREDIERVIKIYQ
jgi:allantoin racemase